MINPLLVAVTAALCLIWVKVYAIPVDPPESPDASGNVELPPVLPAQAEGTCITKGKATWYGKAFHGRETSSGEPYNMYAMTAAHKTLPFGTWIKVTNPANGKEVVLRVNDRGPFAKDVIVDVSFSAAQKLDIVHDGPVPIRLTVLGTRQKEEGQVRYLPVDTDAGKFIILLKICPDFETARVLADQLKEQKQFSSIKKLKKGTTTLYRVFAGPYHSLMQAEEARVKFEAAGYSKVYVVAAF
jgi:rare lipoprotein A